MNALTKQLADAVRHTLTGHAASGGFTRIALSKLTAALASFDDAKDAPDTSGDYPDDFPHENGNCFHICTSCQKKFIGHKRRIDCRVCATPDGSDNLTLLYMAGSASRLAELRVKDAEIADLKRNLGSLRRQINEMDNETGDEVDTAFMQMQRARAAQKKAEAERDSALKSARPNLQPLHDLVAKWKKQSLSYNDNEYEGGFPLGVSRCADQLDEAIANLQSAGEAKP